MNARIVLCTQAYLWGARTTSLASGEAVDMELVVQQDAARSTLLRADGTDGFTAEFLRDTFGARLGESTGGTLVEASLAACAAALNPVTHVVVYIARTEMDEAAELAWRNALHASGGVAAVSFAVAA